MAVEANDASLPAPPKLEVCPPTAVVCKIHVSLTLEQYRKNHTIVLSEIAALSLPRGPWTTSVLVEDIQPKDQVALLCGVELLGGRGAGPISLALIMRQVGALLYSMTSGFDAIGSDDVVTLYIALAEDLVTIFNYLVVG